MAWPMEGTSQSEAQLVSVFNEDISSVEWQLFLQQSMLLHE
jgi:hypothetical protein